MQRKLSQQLIRLQSPMQVLVQKLVKAVFAIDERTLFIVLNDGNGVTIRAQGHEARLSTERRNKATIEVIVADLRDDLGIERRRWDELLKMLEAT